MNTLRTAFLGMILAITALLTGCTETVKSADAEEATTLIVVRHGDRDSALIDQLNETGRARAATLAMALSGMRVDAIYIPDTQRNRETAAPLAAARGLEPNVIETTNLAKRLLAGNQGKTLVWIGNKGNLTTLWADLRANDPPPLKYGDLFIVRVPGTGQGKPQVQRRQFGS